MRRRLVALGIGLIAIATAVVMVVRSPGAIEAVQGISVGQLAVVVALQSVNALGDGVRYRMVLPRRFLPEIDLARWIRVFSIGRLMNTVIPQAGTAYRAAHFRLSNSVPVASFMGSVVVITWLGNAVALLVAAGMVLSTGRVTLAVMLVTGLAAVVLVLVLSARGAHEGRGLARLMPERLRPALARLTESYVELSSDLSRASRVLVATIITQGSGAIAYMVVMAALGVEQPIIGGAVVYASATVATVVSLAPGGLGIAELAAAGGAVILDLGGAVGIVAALVIRVTGIAAVVVQVLIATALESHGASRRQAD